MKRYEYKEVVVDHGSAQGEKTIADTLNMYGEKGWVLCQYKINTIRMGMEFIFMREIHNEEDVFILTDSCMWEANKQLNQRATHAIEVISSKTGQTRFIKTGAQIKFIDGEITEPLSQEGYNNANKI